jgi:hypothetical protein
VVELSSLVDELTTDDNVAGLILCGSRGRGVYVREESDWDLYVVLDDSVALDDYRSGGWLAETLHAITTVDPATAADPLDGYVNLYGTSSHAWSESCAPPSSPTSKPSSTTPRRSPGSMVSAR